MSNPAVFTVSGTYTLSLAAREDGCGWSDKTYKTLIVPGSNGYLIYPNPVTDYLTIESLDSCISPTYVDIIIYDMDANIVDPHLHVDICSRPSIIVNGLTSYNIYIVTISQGGNMLHVQLILKL